MEREEIVLIIKEEVAFALKQDADDFDEDVNLMQLGVTSIEVIKIINQIRKKVPVAINPVALFEYKTIREFSNYLMELLSDEEPAI